MQAPTSTVIAIHNLSDEGCKLQLDLSDHHAERLVDLLREERDIPLKGSSLALDLKGYDHRWFRVRTKPE